MPRKMKIETYFCVDILGVPLYADLKVNHIYRNVQKLYCKVNSVLFDFKDIPSDVKSKLIDTYCLDLYVHNCGNIVRMMLTHFTLPGGK